MKKLFLAATFAIAGITAANAQTDANATQAQTAQTTQATAPADSTSKTEIKLEELPAPVQESLKNEAYKDWTPVAAFLVKDEKAQKEWYQVDVKKGEETGSLNFDKDGKPAQ